MESQEAVRYGKKDKLISSPGAENSHETGEEQAFFPSKGESDVSKPRFACPLYQNNPFKFKRLGCGNDAFSSVKYVEQHLRRHHRRPIHCLVCMTTFSNQEELYCHIREQFTCDPWKGPPLEGLSEYQLDSLKCSRKAGLTERKKWKKLYQILFPQVPENLMPSPYWKLVPSPLEDISNFLDRNLPFMVKEALDIRLATIWHDTPWYDTPKEELREIVIQAQKDAYRYINEPHGPRSSGSQATPPEGTSTVPRPQDDFPRSSMDTMPLGEKMGLWTKTHNEDPTTLDSSEYVQGVGDDEDVADDKYAAHDEGCAHQEAAQIAVSGHEKATVKSAAYESPISSRAKETSFYWDEAQPRSMADQIRHEILARLSTEHINPRRPPDCHTVLFKIPRSSLPFLLQDQQIRSTTNSPSMIADRIVVISASAHDAQVSKVSQYMDQTWPLGGRKVLSVLQNLINGIAKSRTSENKPDIEMMLNGFYLEAIVTGTSHSIAESGEQLAWLTAALQPADPELAISVRPVIRRVKYHAPTREKRHIWVIEVWKEEIDDADVTAHAVQNWQGESTNPVIVRGFPTMSRPEDCLGIEVPSELLAKSLTSVLLERSQTRLPLHATGKVLQLFKHVKGVTVWHILSSPKEVCACRQCFLKENGGDHFPCLDFVELRQHRHIITKCSVAELHNRDSIPQMESGNGSADITQRECSLSETPHFTPNSENTTDSSEFLDVDMLSISDSSECGAGGPSDTDVAIMEVVASRLVSEYRQCTKHNSPPNDCPSNTKQCSPGGQQSFSTHGSSQSTLGLGTTQTSSSNSVRKRPAGQDDDDGDDDEASQRMPVPKKQKSDDTGKVLQLFACPFWKENPNKHRNCYGKKLDMISRVKQHLTRSHHPEFYCERCFVVFPSDDRKQIHLRQVCVSDGTAQLDGITSQQQKKLSRKSDKRLSEYDKWFAVWEIVFPDLDRPSSPYLDLELSQDLNHFREFSERRGPAVLVEVMRDEGLVILEGDEANLLAQRATDRAIRSLFDEWVSQRAESSPNSGSGGSSSTDAVGTQHHQGQQRERVYRLTDLSSNADSGVELSSHPSSGPSRDGANHPRFASIQPRLASDRGPHIVAPAMANPNNDTVHAPSTGPNHWHPFVEPVLIETTHIDTAIQSGENHFDPQSFNSGFGAEWAEDPNLGFDISDFVINPDQSDFRSS